MKNSIVKEMKHTYATIKMFERSTGKLPTLTQIATYSGYTRGAIRSHLNNIQNLGYMKINRGNGVDGNGKYMTYELISPNPWD